jgi:hypothetical protein
VCHFCRDSFINAVLCFVPRPLHLSTRQNQSFLGQSQCHLRSDSAIFLPEMEPQDEDVTVEVEDDHPETLQQQEAEFVTAVGSEGMRSKFNILVFLVSCVH